eukprot:TRINITY_DN12346_c0_g1_i1.p2 TRINITY_DN12346_c0_g1~~TRINITY_DN12346_c0_g1_i1.p2  ORF type:complete len:272 (+),score=86.92 TRINITY_DN12346_c0_g1_i1:104-817(+)
MAEHAACTQEELVKFYRVRQTCVEMLQDRGYEPTDSQLVESLEDFTERFTKSEGGQMWLRKEDLRLFGERPDPEEEEIVDDKPEDIEERRLNRSIMVFFVAEPKFSHAHIRNYYNMLEKDDRGCSRGIIVSAARPTSQCNTAIEACATSGKIFEHFLESELLINVSRHELVPKHQPLNLKEKRTLLDALKIKEGQLPRILAADPIARHFGLRKGNVVRITRPSDTAGEYVTYRLCQA